MTPAPVINIHLGPSLLPRHSLSLPALSAGTSNISTLVSTSAATTKTPAEALLPSSRLLCISTPTDKSLLQSEGSTIWAIRSGDVGEDVDELVKEGHVADAIGLVEAVGEDGLSPVSRLPR